MTFTCEIEGASVVLLGNFNPALVHPQWLLRHDLVRESEANAATVQLVRPELSLFTVGPFTLQTEPGRFMASINDLGQLPPLRDLVNGVFSILGQTPIKTFGLNRQMHFRVKDVETWHRVGDRLAPKALWAGLVDQPGLRSLTVEGRRSGSEAKLLLVTVEPSVRIDSSVYVGVNERFEAASDEAATILDLMNRVWDDSFAHSARVGEEIAALGAAQ